MQSDLLTCFIILIVFALGEWGKNSPIMKIDRLEITMLTQNLRQALKIVRIWGQNSCIVVYSAKDDSG